MKAQLPRKLRLLFEGWETMLGARWPMPFDVAMLSRLPGEAQYVP